MKRLRIVCAFSVVAVSLTLVGTEQANATFPAKNGLIAFAADTGDEGFQLFTVRRTGHGLQQVTHGPGQASSPDWSPDGRWLAYTLDECTIALIRADGTDQRVIPSQPPPDGCDGDPVFTPDGDHLVFGRFDPAIEEESVWIMDLNGGNQRRIGTGPSGSATPEVSPDGQTVTFLSTTANGLDALFAIDINGGTARQVTPTLWGIAFKHDWAPDGSRIVVSDNAGDTPDQPTNMATVRPNGTGLRYLTDLQTPDQRALAGGYSPDGKWIVFRRENGDQNALRIVRTDGQGEQTVLPFSSFKPRFIDWGPAAS
jgi:dipeptidyl aminopeptidase/acylaminoacyl peptidase